MSLRNQPPKRPGPCSQTQAKIKINSSTQLTTFSEHRKLFQEFKSRPENSVSSTRGLGQELDSGSHLISVLATRGLLIIVSMTRAWTEGTDSMLRSGER